MAEFTAQQQKQGILYPKYQLVGMFGQMDYAEKKFPGKRFLLEMEPPKFLIKGYEQKKAFWLPHFIMDCGIADDLQSKEYKKRKEQTLMILRTCFPTSTDCWRWLGAMSGSYPAVHYRKKLRGALKVLLARLTNGEPEEFKTQRGCSTEDCINPMHHKIDTYYNVPFDPKVLKDYPKNRYWTYPYVLPWEIKSSQIKVLDKIPEVEYKDTLQGNLEATGTFEEFQAMLNIPIKPEQTMPQEERPKQITDNLSFEELFGTTTKTPQNDQD